MNAQQTINNLLPDTLLKIHQIVKIPGQDNMPLVPVSRSSWYAGVKSGIFPAPVKLGVKSVAWRASDIIALIESLGAQS